MPEDLDMIAALRRELETAQRQLAEIQRGPWQTVSGNAATVVRRLPVPGGWLYQVESEAGNGDDWHQPVFVPDPGER